MQLVFIHGPGAGGTSLAWTGQLEHFPGSYAPDLPGALEGARCPDVARYAEWLRGWLWALGKKKDLVLVGYTLGSSIALQYALDYPSEIAGLVLTSVEIGPRTPPRSLSILDRCMGAQAGEAGVYEDWIDFQRHNLMLVEPAYRERLLNEHRRVGPHAQHDSLVTLFGFDVRERIGTLKPPLLLIRGEQDPTHPPEGEQEIRERVPHAQLIRLNDAGHFPATERPAQVNRLIEEFLGMLGGNAATQAMTIASEGQP